MIFFQEKRHSLKSVDRQQNMVEFNRRSSNTHEHQQANTEETVEDINSIPQADSHWLRLLARLNGNWLQ